MNRDRKTKLFSYFDAKSFDLDQSLHQFRETYGVHHVVYHAARLNARAVDDPFVRLTYSADWIKQYLVRGYVMVDPVLRTGFMRIAPFDWSELTIETEAEVKFFEDAQRFNVGQSGWSIPVRDKTGRRALFTISSNLTGLEWTTLRDKNSADWMEFANRFHKKAARFQQLEVDTPAMSPREIDCIFWAAKGKTAAKAAEILGISQATVTGYLASARYKLDCASVSQLVATALALNLIDAPDS